MVPDATGTGSHRGGRTTTSDLVARDRSRTGDVQRRQVAVQRDRRHQVAALSREVTDLRLRLYGADGGFTDDEDDDSDMDAEFEDEDDEDTE